MVCNDLINNSMCDVMVEAGTGINVFLSRVSEPFMVFAIVLATFLILLAIVVFLARAVMKANI